MCKVHNQCREFWRRFCTAALLLFPAVNRVFEGGESYVRISMPCGRSNDRCEGGGGYFAERELADRLGRDKRTIQKWEKGEMKIALEDFLAV